MFYDELTNDYEAVEIPAHSVAYPLLKISGEFRRALEHDYGVSMFVVSAHRTIDTTHVTDSGGLVYEVVMRLGRANDPRTQHEELFAVQVPSWFGPTIDLELVLKWLVQRHSNIEHMSKETLMDELNGKLVDRAVLVKQLWDDAKKLESAISYKIIVRLAERFGIRYRSRYDTK